MGGAKIEENMLIDKTIHKAIDARSAVLKVYAFCYHKKFRFL
jgi:choline transporter-like protein 2/4/5